jgi:hypothetical protein
MLWAGLQAIIAGGAIGLRRIAHLALTGQPQHRPMQSTMNALIGTLEQAAAACGYDKDKLEGWVQHELEARKEGALWLVDHQHQRFALRLARSKGIALPNTILGFKRLLKHDAEPIVIVQVYGQSIRFLLANSTLVAKVSHSSVGLTATTIVGSINGTDVLPASRGGVANTGHNLAALFAVHQAADKASELARIVQATRSISSWRAYWTIDWELVRTNLEKANAAAATAIPHAQLEALLTEVEQEHGAILELAQRTPGKLPGKKIEQLLTNTMVRHAFGDVSTTDGLFEVDIKAHRQGTSSNPKAFNMDKVLRLLHERPVMPLYLFVVVGDAQLQCRYLPMLHQNVLGHTRWQNRWSGRNAYGGTQLTGEWPTTTTGTHAYTMDVDSAITRLKAWVEEAKAAHGDQAS